MTCPGTVVDETSVTSTAMIPASAPKSNPPKTVGEAITIPYYRTIGGESLVGLRGVFQDSPCLKKYCNTRLQQVSPGVQLVVK